MKIYTKTGDDGTTSLYGGKRVAKSNLRIDAYGTVDELNSVLGICRSLEPPKKVDIILKRIQNQLFNLGADLATPISKKDSLNFRINSDDIKFLEISIDKYDAENKPLKKFILPAGSIVSTYLHFARTVCRRAERLVVKLAGKETINKNTIVYLNRLSDLLFVMARWVNKKNKIREIFWEII